VFHDFKKQGVPPAPPGALDRRRRLGASLLNRQGTTWRRLDAATQAGVQDAASCPHCC
jgi:arsenate reductase